MKQLLVLGPKGGVGKTTVVRNLAVAGVLSGLRVIVVDTDRQRTLSRWVDRRPESLPLIQHAFIGGFKIGRKHRSHALIEVVDGKDVQTIVRGGAGAD